MTGENEEFFWENLVWDKERQRPTDRENTNETKRKTSKENVKVEKTCD